jgi:hypothetical protein
MLGVIKQCHFGKFQYAECRYDECHNAVYHYGKCQNTEFCHADWYEAQCHYAVFILTVCNYAHVIMLSDIELSVVMLIIGLLLCCHKCHAVSRYPEWHLGESRVTKCHGAK